MTGSLPTIAIVATGGTIANTPRGRAAIEAVLDEIGTRYPEHDPTRLANIRILDVLRAGAETFTPREWVTIAEAVAGAVRANDVAGVVVTHGTFTAEETAYFLHLTVRTEKPVVMACSQRKHGTIGNDGDKNLCDAIRVSCAPDAAAKGVLVVVNEEIHSARDVMKTNQRPSGFRSGSLGILGSVESDRVTFYRSPTRRHTKASEFEVPVDGVLPRVDIVATYAGADGVAAQALLEAGSRGIVVNGFSYNGRPHDSQLPALQEALDRSVPVVLVNRGGDGRIPLDQDDGFVRADNLTAQKARVLLALAARTPRDRADLQRIFDEY